MPKEHWSSTIPENGSPAVLKEMQRLREEGARVAEQQKTKKSGSTPEIQSGGKRN